MIPSFKQFIAEAKEKYTGMMGLNINDDTAPWTDMILSGEKTIETRTNDRLIKMKYVGKRVGLVRTGKKRKATLVGYATIGEPIIYTSPEEFNKDFKKHRVAPDNSLYNGGVKYGYPLLDVKACEPKPVDSRGIIARRVDDEL